MKTVRMLLLTAAVGSAVAARGTGGGARSHGPSAASPSAFVLREWTITAPTTQVRAGKVSVTASNRGNETHELVIVRADDAASLPTKSNGSVDEAKIPGAAKPGEIADIKPGRTVIKTVALTPGNYVAICNLVDTMGQGSGDGGMGQGGGMGGGQMEHIHYRLGMVAKFTVA